MIIINDRVYAWKDVSTKEQQTTASHVSIPTDATVEVTGLVRSCKDGTVASHIQYPQSRYRITTTNTSTRSFPLPHLLEAPI